MMEYYKEYELLGDLPTGEKAGDHFFFHVTNDVPSKMWYQVGGKSNLGEYQFRNPDTEGIKLTMEQMKPEFFKPVGKPYELYPDFPTKEGIKEFYYLIGESKMVNSVDEVRAIGEIFYSEEYYEACYEILKEMYNKKFNK